MSEVDHERFFSLTQQGINEPQQRTPEWFEKRKNKLSGSKLSNFLFCKTDEERLIWYEEVFEGRKKPPFTDEQLDYMAWGSKHEDTAMLAFLERKQDIMAFEAPHVQHNSVEWLSATPDGFYQIFDTSEEDLKITDQGILEIKCPGKSKKYECSVYPSGNSTR